MKIKSLIIAIIGVLSLYAFVLAQSPLIGSVVKDANLRSGPGTTYAIMGALKPGQPVTIIGKNPTGDWYHLSNGHWVFGALVKVFGTATPVATATPTITGTRPTSTATATATKTPAPTNTPLPTLAPTRIDYINDPVAKTYVAGIQDALKLYVDGSSVLNAQFSALSSNTYLLVNNSWKTKIVLGLTELNLFSRGIRKLEPPVYFTEIHNDFLETADHTDRAVDLLVSGIDNLNSDDLAAGANEFQLANASMNSSNKKLDEFLANNAKQVPASTPTSSTNIDDATWFSGGTLQNASVGEWNNATQENKLATSADWAIDNFDLTTTSNELRFYTQGLLICVDVAAESDSNDTDPISDIVKTCVSRIKNR